MERVGHSVGCARIPWPHGDPIAVGPRNSRMQSLIPILLVCVGCGVMTWATAACPQPRLLRHDCQSEATRSSVPRATAVGEHSRINGKTQSEAFEMCNPRSGWRRIVQLPSTARVKSFVNISTITAAKIPQSAKISRVKRKERSKTGVVSEMRRTPLCRVAPAPPKRTSRLQN